MPRRLALLDTSFILALENRDDPLHSRAKQIDRDLLREGCVLLLHTGILLEIGDGYARVQRREKGAELLERFRREAGFRVVPLTNLLLEQAVSLYRERPDKDWGLTDCVSFIVMRQSGVTDALTADAHFRQAGFRALLLE